MLHSYAYVPAERLERSSTYPKFEEIRVPSLYRFRVNTDGPVHDTLVVVG